MTSLQQVSAAVQRELEGPGKLLGYRAMHHKLRTHHGIRVPRHLVHSMMADLDPDGLDARNLQKRPKRKKKPFESDGPLSLVSLDGHDKLCGYQNWTFPLAVYGCLDTFSRKILFLFVSHSNSDPLIIGNKYLAYLTETQILPKTLRLDRGTETGKMASIHVFLRDKIGDLEDAMNSIVFGPSTTNKIERWWRDLHERLEKYFKHQLSELLSNRQYDPHNMSDRKLLYYVYKPIIERECSIFVGYWNSHRIREQKGLLLPTGVPHHMFSFPESYGTTNKGLHITTANLKEVAEVSGVLEAPIRRQDAVGRIATRTEKFNSSFYPNCIQEWNTLDPEIRLAPSVTVFKKKLLSIIRPTAKSVFGIHDPLGLSYLSQLRVGLSKLNFHKFNHNFKDTLNPLCPTNDGIEDTEHFLLLCPSFDIQRSDLLAEISQLLQPFVQVNNLSNIVLIKLLLYGDKDFSDSINKSILQLTINFIHKTGRFG